MDKGTMNVSVYLNRTETVLQDDDECEVIDTSDTSDLTYTVNMNASLNVDNDNFELSSFYFSNGDSVSDETIEYSYNNAVVFVDNNLYINLDGLASSMIDYAKDENSGYDEELNEIGELSLGWLKIPMNFINDTAYESTIDKTKELTCALSETLESSDLQIAQEGSKYTLTLSNAEDIQKCMGIVTDFLSSEEDSYIDTALGVYDYYDKDALIEIVCSLSDDFVQGLCDGFNITYDDDAKEYLKNTISTALEDAEIDADTMKEGLETDLRTNFDNLIDFCSNLQTSDLTGEYAEYILDLTDSVVKQSFTLKNEDGSNALEISCDFTENQDLEIPVPDSNGLTNIATSISPTIKSLLDDYGMGDFAESVSGLQLTDILNSYGLLDTDDYYDTEDYPCGNDIINYEDEGAVIQDETSSDNHGVDGNYDCDFEVTEYQD
jgi:hypothetical protein